MAVVAAVENTRYREDGGSACLTTRVKTLKAHPDRYAVLEPAVRDRGPVRTDHGRRGQ
ncbi:hypothetical protein ACFQ8S_00975 [Streptomyces virginiae]|uniref:hypothetical protein n=1 Tax=Streptomyces virginiae TaxID=1961 RepID=UPI00369620A1